MDSRKFFESTQFLSLSANERLAMLTLAANAMRFDNFFGVSWMLICTEAQLAEMMGVSEITVRRLMPRLREKGMIAYKQVRGIPSEISIFYPSH